MHKLPHDDGNNKDGNADVGSDEIRSIPIALEEHGEPGNEGDDDCADEAEPGRVGLERGFPRQSVAADALHLHGTVEADVAEAEGTPGDQTSDSAEVQKPGEGLGGTTSSETWRS